MKLTLSLVTAAFLLLVSSVAAQTKGPTPSNGCGSGWSSYMVPDSIPLLQCNFKPACDVHDECYDKCSGSVAGTCEYQRCRKGGNLEGSVECVTNVRLQKLSVLAQERRLACDDGLASLIRGVNKGKFACEAVAIVYRGAVRAFGDEAFNGAKVFSDSDQTREQYDQEVAAFFRQGTEEQFRRLVVGDGVVGSVSFNRPLRFDPALGLVNKTP